MANDVGIVLNNITLDLKKSGTQATINVKKGDIQSRAVLITLRCDGRNYRVNDGVTAIFRAKKPDNTVIYNNATVQDGKVYFLLTSNYCAVKGKYTGEIQLLKEGRVLYAPKFSIIVEDNIYDDSEIESTNEYTQLTEAIEDAQEALETAQELQLIKYVTDLDDPGDKKYLYVLENTKPYIDIEGLTGWDNAWLYTIFETTDSTYPFIALHNIKLYNHEDDTGILRFNGYSHSGTWASLYKYNKNTGLWENQPINHSTSIQLAEVILLTDEADESAPTPLIDNFTVKSIPLYHMEDIPVVIMNLGGDGNGYYVRTFGTLPDIEYSADDNPFDLDDIPEILAEPIGFPYVYDEVTNQYVALEDANVPNILTRLTAAESNIATLQSGKQDKLTAGDGITIVNNVISAIGGGGGLNPIIFDKTSSPITSTCTFSELKTLYDTYGGALPIYIYANPFTSGTGNRYYPLSELYYDETNNWFKLYFDKTADQTYNKYVEVLTFKSDDSIVNTFLHSLSQPWLREENAGEGISITSGGESLKISVNYPNGDIIEY